MPAYSNKGFGFSWHTLKSSESGLKRDVFLGIKYQCVEYARRFMVVNQLCAFEDIGTADKIFDLTTVINLF